MMKTNFQKNMYNTVIIRYGEIGIKSPKTRKRFEKILITNIVSKLKELDLNLKVKKEWGRIFIENGDIKPALDALKTIFGIVSFSPACTAEPTVDSITSTAVKYAKRILKQGTFAVRARRTGGQPFTSKQLEEIVGKEILHEFGDKISVNLSAPNITIHIEVRENRAYIFHEVHQGLGGLPLGTQGKVVCLISGGIDSPVASFLIMKRGCIPVYVYFDSAPFIDETPKNKSIEIVKKLKEYAPGIPLKMYIIPHGGNLSEIIKYAPENMTCILCKRFMYRLAEKVTEKESADGIVTGESMGQKASQTLRNFYVISSAIQKYPIFRPLLGLDKVEIENIAKKIGTFDISIRPSSYCTLNPKKPLTHANLESVLKVEDKLKINELIQEAFRKSVILEI